MTESTDTDRQIEIIQLKSTVETIRSEVADNWVVLKELSQRKIPWLGILSTSLPLLTIIMGVSLQSIMTVSLTSDRIQQIQKSIEQNAVIQQRQFDIHSVELKELKQRMDRIENELSRAKSIKPTD